MDEEPHRGPVSRDLPDSVPQRLLTLSELENFAETRVRRSKQDGERLTGQIVAACFRHDTSRELDPHLHTHCVVFNATFDPAEKRWKALHASGMYRAQKFAENLYYHELSKGLRTLGYQIENNARDFEIKGVPAFVIARFSKRHMEIELETNRRVAREGLRGNLAALREQVAHSKRRRKQENSTANDLRASWAKQIRPVDQDALQQLRHPVFPQSPVEVSPFIAWADQQLFERRSVVQDYELKSAALARARGENFALSDLTAAIDSYGYVREPGTLQLTSREVLGRELDLVLAAADGRFMHAPLSYVAVVPTALTRGKKVPSLSEVLSTLPLAMQTTDGQFTNRVQEMARSNNVQLRPGLACQSFPQTLAAVRSGRFAAIVPELAVQELPPGSVHKIAGEQLRQLEREIILVWNPRVILVRPHASKIVARMQSALRFS